jgi:hypothetical protein
MRFEHESMELLKEATTILSLSARSAVGPLGNLTALSLAIRGRQHPRFVAAGFGVAVVSEPLQRIPAKNVIFRGLAA